MKPPQAWRIRYKSTRSLCIGAAPKKKPATRTKPEAPRAK